MASYIDGVKYNVRMALELDTENKLQVSFSLSFRVSHRLALMWQQSGILLFCSCHGIAGFLVVELQI